MSGSPLRVAILIDTLIQPAWAHRVLEDIRTAPHAQLALVIRNATHREPTLPELIRDYRRQLLPLLYDRLDARLVRHLRQPDAFAPRTIEPLVADAPIIEVHTTRKRYSDYFPDQDVEQILAYDLDVALRFGFRILRGRALGIARYGVWSYHHGDNLEIRGGPNSFWEVMQAWPTTGSVLQVLTPDLDNGKVIYRSHSATNPLSLSLNRNRHYWKSAAFVARKLRDLHERGPAALDDASPSEFQAYDNRLYRRPTNLEAVPILARFGARLATRAARRLLSSESWFVAYRFAPGQPDEPPAFHHFRRLLAPPGRSWSQPFPLEADGRCYLFLTERTAARAHTRIAVVEIDERGVVGDPRVALEGDERLAYPCVFRWQDRVYMLPDTPCRHEVALYRCTRFPDTWTEERVLLSNVRAAHATLAEIKGTWWLFVALAEQGAATTDELHLFHAESPLGPWQPHPCNPVKSDVRSARPAGRLFEWRGRLYRPAQDCSRGDPYAISINRVDELSLDRYVETEVSRIRPRWQKGLVANGVFNRAGGLMCIDGAVRRWLS